METLGYTLVFADPLIMVREGLVRLLETSSNCRVLAQCGTGPMALQCIESTRPDIAILDGNLPQLMPNEILKKLRFIQSPTKVIVLSNRQDRNYMLEMFRAGADAFVLKSDSGLALLEACEQVMQDRYYVSPLMQNTDLPAVPRDSRLGQDPLELLSNREYQVFSMLVEGVRAKEIAHRLSLSPKTIDTHRASLMRKLDIHDVPGLVKFAISRNLISIA